MVVSSTTKPQKVKKWASRERALQGLRWPNLDQLGPEAGPGAHEPVGGGLAGGDQPGDPLGPLAGQGDREGEHGPDGELHRTSSRPVASAAARSLPRSVTYGGR